MEHFLASISQKIKIRIRDNKERIIMIRIIRIINFVWGLMEKLNITQHFAVF